MPTASPRLLSFVVVCSLLSSPAMALAGAAVNSNGFESPNFAAGDISGQDGWLTVGGGASTATIQSTEVLSGTQALRVDRAGGSDRFWLQQIGSAPSGRFVSIDWDMLVEETPISSGFGPFLGVQTFDDSSGGVLQSTGLGVDASTGDILYQQGGTGFFAESDLVVDFDEWVHFRIDLDFENKTYSGFANDIPVIVDEGFVDGNTIATLSDADIAAVGAGGDAASVSNPGVGFFDNFLVRDGLRSDYNSDGIVSAADYTVFRDTFSQTGLGAPADGDADGVVAASDFDVFASSFGASNAISLPVAAATVAVPEPNSLAISLGILAMALGRTRPRPGSAN